MPTEAQIRANRENAKKSTGPKTKEGKRISSQNALLHGFTANQLVIDRSEAEIFPAFAENITNELRPQTQLELNLVDHIIGCAWRLRRAPRFEADHLKALKGDPYESLGQRLFKDDQQKRLFALSNHETRIEKSMARAFAQLAQIRAIIEERSTQEERQVKWLDPIRGQAELQKDIDWINDTERQLEEAANQLREIRKLKDRVEDLLDRIKHYESKITDCSARPQTPSNQKELSLALERLHNSQSELLSLREHTARLKEEKNQKTKPIEKAEIAIEKEMKKLREHVDVALCSAEKTLAAATQLSPSEEETHAKIQAVPPQIGEERPWHER